MAVALHGNLRDFGIGEVFQLIGQQRKTGVLEVTCEQERIRVAFDHGAVVRGEAARDTDHAALGDMLVRMGLITPAALAARIAEADQRDQPLAKALVAAGSLDAGQVEDAIDLLTRNSIFALLRWTRGSFHFSATSVAHGRPPDRLLPAEQILMDGLRMVDEWRTFDEKAAREETVFQRAGRFEVYRASHPEASPHRLAEAERLFLLVDGRLSVRRVIDLSRVGDFEGTRLLSELRRAGLIEPLDPALVERRRVRLPRFEAQRPALLGAGLSLVPIALLALLVFAIPRPVAPPPDPLRPDPAQVASADFETRRLRHAVEAFRYARGRWPTDLAEVSAFLGDGDRMASPGTGPYHYARFGDAWWVLAPE